VTRLLAPALLTALLLTGCHAPQLPTPATEQAQADQHALADSQREQLAQIPPPSKNRYMAIRTFESWQNPALTIQPSMIELRVLLADANPSSYGAGGLLRPENARRQELNISLDKLADAVTAIPQTAWPYGRVIAIEEAHKTPKNMEPTVRRNMELAIAKLNELGIIVYDPTEGNLR